MGLMALFGLLWFAFVLGVEVNKKVRPFRLVRGNIMHFSLLPGTRSEATERRRRRRRTRHYYRNQHPTPPVTTDGNQPRPPKTPNFGAQFWVGFRFSNQFLRHGLVHFLYRNNPPKKTKQKEVLSLGCLGFSFLVCVHWGRKVRNAKQSNACVVDKGEGGCSRREALGAERESEEGQEKEQKSELGFVGFRVSLGM
jgi:hypothetical protein